MGDDSVSPEMQDHRATNQMVADLFGQMGLRVDVLERLRTLPGMSPSRGRKSSLSPRRIPKTHTNSRIGLGTGKAAWRRNLWLSQGPALHRGSLSA